MRMRQFVFYCKRHGSDFACLASRRLAEYQWKQRKSLIVEALGSLGRSCGLALALANARLATLAWLGGERTTARKAHF